MSTMDVMFRITGARSLQFAWIFLFLLAYEPVLADPSDTVRFSDVRQQLSPSVHRFIQYTETQDGLILFNSILTRSIQLTQFRGRKAFLIVQTYQTPKHIDRDSSYCDVVTLRPLGYFTEVASNQQREVVLFDSGLVNNSIQYKDSSQLFSRKDVGSYNGVMADDLIALLPLRKHGHFVFPTLNPGAHYTEYTTVVEVEAKELLKLGNGQSEMCWRLRVSTGSSYTLQWFSVKGHRQLKKQFMFKNGNVFYRYSLNG